MTSRQKLAGPVVALVLGFGLAGCVADTAIGSSVDGAPTANPLAPDGGPSGARKPDALMESCPVGPMAPLGAACSTPSLRCQYGYNVPGCGGRTVICTGGTFVEESHADPGPNCGPTDARPLDSKVDAKSDAKVDAKSDANPDVAKPDVDAKPSSTKPGCCPISPSPSGCMYTGGADHGGRSCEMTCDFFCSTNWRIETDQQGCEVWRWDRRAPAPGENSSCFAGLDSKSDVGKTDAGS
jgi:hypothetical protein